MPVDCVRDTSQKALALTNSEQNSVRHNNDENNRALVSIIVPGYENVEVDDKSIISSFLRMFQSF